MQTIGVNFCMSLSATVCATCTASHSIRHIFIWLFTVLLFRTRLARYITVRTAQLTPADQGHTVDTCWPRPHSWHMLTKATQLTPADQGHTVDTCWPRPHIWHLLTKATQLTPADQGHAVDTCWPRPHSWHLLTKATQLTPADQGHPS
jgi:hypothetical protein